MPSSSSLLIKGYLPVRLRLSDNEFETFFYVKEHVGASNNTLFVSNCPVVPGIRTKLLLKSIFGRYGEIARVTCVQNPRQGGSSSSTSSGGGGGGGGGIEQWTTNFSAPSYAAPNTSDGKFAHVVFDTSKDMKKTLKSLTEAMASDDPALTLDKIETQTLADETDRQMREELKQDEDHDDDKKSSGILAVAARYRMSCQRLSRKDLLLECNTVMETFEDAETEERRLRDTAVPDDDGFVTVSYGNSNTGSKRELEQSGDQRGRKSGAKRQRKKKMGGAAPLTDFYRFQTKETRKKSLQELRERFEDDLQKVKRLKEERKYRPF